MMRRIIPTPPHDIENTAMASLCGSPDQTDGKSDQHSEDQSGRARTGIPDGRPHVQHWCG